MSNEPKRLCFMSGEKCPKKDDIDKKIKEDRDSNIKRVFVLMPFKPPYYDYYRFAIDEVYSRDKVWECKYVEKSTLEKGEYIICKICEEIQIAELVIADLSEKNPNVYYELGIAHALGKKTIIIMNKNEGGVSDNFRKFLAKLHLQPLIYSGIEDLKGLLEGQEGKPFVIDFEKTKSLIEGEKYEITDKSLKKLRSAGVPDVVLKELEKIKNEEMEEKIFSKTLEKIIDEVIKKEIEKVIEKEKDSKKGQEYNEAEFKKEYDVYKSLIKEHARDKRYTVICLIPEDDPAERRQIKFSEVFEFGIKEGIEQLEFPGDDLIDMDKEDIRHITKEAQEAKCKWDKDGFANLINHIMKARYCIIDITEVPKTEVPKTEAPKTEAPKTEAHPEVFYWLGFIHGLGVNRHVDMKEIPVCIYITSGRLEKLPFDIRAARVIQYRSLEELVLRIPLELEKLEVERICRFNKAKKEFWRGFTIKNTRFLIGSADVLHPQDPHPSDRVSTHDFKGFNRIVYLLLFSGGRRPYQYEMRIVELAEFIKYTKDGASIPLETYLKSDSSTHFDNWHGNPRDFSIAIDKDNFNKLGFNRSGEVMNYVVISSSCINAPAEMVMSLLYGKKAPDYLFSDTRPYKARSSFWKHFKEKEKLGIYLSKTVINPLPDLTEEKKLEGWTETESKKEYSRIGKRYSKESVPSFCEEEFKSPLTIGGLCQKIINDKYDGISLEQNIDSLNKILSIPDFYEKVNKKKPDLKFSENIKELVKRTKDYRKKNFSDLNENEKGNINRLNRLLLEETYPEETPKSQDVDSGLLIILKDPKIFEEKAPQIFKDIKDQEIFKNIEVKGEIILLCGHGAFGTYELCRMISNIINKDNKKDNKDKDLEDKIFLPAFKYKKKEKGTGEEKEVEVDVKIDDFFSVVNGIRKEKEKEKESYCIEAVFNFKNDIDFNVHSKTTKELVTFFNFDRKEGKRRNLLEDLAQRCPEYKEWRDKISKQPG